MCLCRVEFPFYLWTKTLLISGLLKNLINPHIERKMTFWEAVDPWSMWVLGVAYHNLFNCFSNYINLYSASETEALCNPDKGL